VFLLVFLQAPGNLAFHVLTDAQNFYAMKYWFTRNSFNRAALHVINYEAFVWKKLPKYSIRQLYLQEEFRVLVRSTKQPTENTRMEYLSLFSHSHFLIPEIFKYLKKVVVLDDDVVVQHDLSFLWNIDMGDKVNGAVEFCGLKLSQVSNLLGKTAYDRKSCAWMSGVNLINLDKWREHNVTENYLLLMKKVCIVRSQLISRYIVYKNVHIHIRWSIFVFLLPNTNSQKNLFCTMYMWFEQQVA
jgi:alpha-1,4-galacturonosyltransferase